MVLGAQIQKQLIRTTYKKLKEENIIDLNWAIQTLYQEKWY